MKKINKVFIFFSVILFFFIQNLKSQDIHFSQYYYSPLRMSPALSGVFNQDARFIGNSKLQWFNVPVDYKTFAVSYDAKIQNSKRSTGFYTWGTLLDYDWSGASNLGNFHFGLNGSYTKKIGDLSLITIGFQVGMIQRHFGTENLTFDKQYNGDIFDPKRANGELFNSYNKLIFDIGTGLNYRYQLNDKRTKFDFGGGIFHPQSPNASFSKVDNVPLPRRITAHILTTVKASKKIDGIFNLYGQNQGRYNEFYGGGGVRYYINQTKYHESSMFFGAHYRFSEQQDAIIPMIDFEHQNWKVGLSYDYTISGFAIANNRRGGPELSFQYFINKVKAIKASKNCPVF